MTRTLPIVAVLLASVALWVAVSRTSGPGNTTQIAAAGADGAGGLAAPWEHWQRELRAVKVAQSSLAARIAELEQRQSPPNAAAPDLGLLKQQLDELEARQTQIAQFTRDIDKYGVIDTMEKELVAAYATLMDTNQAFWARIKQVGQLKRYGYLDEKALAAVTDLYHQTGDFNEKGGVLAALKGSVTPAFRDQILTDLNAEIATGNHSARFRYHAIEALEPMLPDPAVQYWLHHLAQSDPEPKLANRAGQALGLAPPGGPRK
jgi:hypothetical protein